MTLTDVVSGSMFKNTQMNAKLPTLFECWPPRDSEKKLTRFVSRVGTRCEEVGTDEDDSNLAPDVSMPLSAPLELLSP